MNPLHLFYITNIRIMQDITNGRCGWCGTDELYVKYHDQEWGKLGVSCIGKCPSRTKLDNDS